MLFDHSIQSCMRTHEQQFFAQFTFRGWLFVALTFLLELFDFDSIHTRFLKLMLITEGKSLQGSPSTCIGIVREVIILALRHCAMQVPWPPACNNGS